MKLPLASLARRAVPVPVKRSLRILTKPVLPWPTRCDLLAVELRMAALRLRHPRVPRRQLQARRDATVRLGPVTAIVSSPNFHIDYITLFDKVVADQFKADYRGAVVLDIGAHCGYMAAYAFFHGASAVVSYEPEGHNFEVLARTRDGADLGDRTWEVHRLAVGAERRRVELYVSPNSRSHSVIPGSVAVGQETVDMVPFSDVLAAARALAPGAPVVVKLNVEGAAGEIVMGTPQEMWREVHCLLMDWEDQTPVPLADGERHLAGAGLLPSHRWGSGRHFRFSRM